MISQDNLANLTNQAIEVSNFPAEFHAVTYWHGISLKALICVSTHLI